MAKSKSWASKAVRSIVEDLREEAKNIYTHAGAFLMREVCDKLADLLEAAARRVRDLEEEVAKYQSDLLRTDEEARAVAYDLDNANATIERLEGELAAYRQRELPFASADAEASSDSTEGLTGGQGFPKGTA